MGKGVVKAARIHQATALQHHWSLQGKEGMGRIKLALSGHAPKQFDATVAVIGGCQGSLTAQTQAAHRLHPLLPMLGH